MRDVLSSIAVLRVNQALTVVMMQAIFHNAKILRRVKLSDGVVDAECNLVPQIASIGESL